MGGRRWVLALVGASVTLTGCVGSITRDAFTDEARSRGGGLSADLLIELAETAERRSGTAELRIRSAGLSFMSANLSASPAEAPAEVDDWFLSSSLIGPRPGSNLDEDELSAFFTVDDLDAETIERAIDEALAGASMRSPWATSVWFEPAESHGYVATISLTNERQDERWEFGPDGVVQRVG
jgi:hypothetical protein